MGEVAGAGRAGRVGPQGGVNGTGRNRQGRMRRKDSKSCWHGLGLPWWRGWERCRVRRCKQWWQDPYPLKNGI